MKNLYTKLFAIQKLALAVSKDGNNPHFRSTYPTLDNVISAVIPEANKIGLLVTHFVDGDHLVTRVVDTESGESLDSKFQMIGTTPQQRGSEQTYFRRYSMMAIFNLPCEDDDGNIATAPAKQEPAEWIDKTKIASLIEKIKAGELVASSGDEAVKIARQYFKISKENAEIIKSEFSKHII